MLPHLTALRLERVWLKGVRVRIDAATTAEQAGCPGCGCPSPRGRSRYVRHLVDTVWRAGNGGWIGVRGGMRAVR